MAVKQSDVRFAGIVSATRLHLPPETTEIPEATVQHLRNYVVSVQQLGIVAAVAVNACEEAVRHIAEEVAPGFKVYVLPVPCWGNFVPALNTLLNFSQQCSMKYILYQSLEVQCRAAVLQKLLDHHTHDTLVVGPVFSGHDFRAGEQPLNGRTTPWNTLALWSMRKLALTGFLCIADGLPDVPPSIGREGQLNRAENPQEPESLSQLGPMGSNTWWTQDLGTSHASSVPAGVEEVTAIALLQHLHGKDHARAVLLQLPRELEAELCWEASWGKDERRAAWHKYKMESKVSRPAAQMEELFKLRRVRSTSWSSDDESPKGNATGKLGCLRRLRSESEIHKQDVHCSAQEGTTLAAKPGKEAGVGDGAVGHSPNFATVMHYGESIAPPNRVLWICLASCGLFSANSTAVLASAFRMINADVSAPATAFVGLLIGAVYLPMPLSLWLTRTATRRAHHIAGLALFGGVLLLGHACTVLAQLLGWGAWVPLIARLVQGLGSGIGFQARFVLASLSTSDQHAKQQSLIFLANDLGLGLGALLPVALQPVTGSGVRSPDLMTSAVLACISLLYLAWVALAFPMRPPFLPDRVRFPLRRPGELGERAASKEASAFRMGVFVSGTMRVFVQSAILPVAALSMRDAHWTGNFRQTFAVAAICLLPMPFEALASRMCCGCSLRLRSTDGVDSSKLASGFIGAIALAIVSGSPRSVSGEEGETPALLMRICELAILMIALAMAAPFNASKLYQLSDAERAIVQLEWMKAYCGRLLGPLCAVLLYSWVGYHVLLGLLCIATGVVILTT
mmetsp:Transcript_110143/g.322265  ORF Transcript_110143/g.322265 Transcript_110143/m.322265 type:complete len:795 (+) Transcript_110143:68-2452(+)